MSNKKVKLEISLEETKLIFEALGTRPFSEVYELIGKLNEQVNQNSIQENNINEKTSMDSQTYLHND